MTYAHNIDKYYMQLALKQAAEAHALGEVPIGAIIVAPDGKLLAQAHNLVEQLKDPTAHAEILAIGAACQALGSKYLVGCRLYVTIEPCPMCAGAIRWSRLQRVIYGAGEEKFGYRTFSPLILPRSCSITSDVCTEEARALMQSFFKARR